MNETPRRRPGLRLGWPLAAAIILLWASQAFYLLLSFSALSRMREEAEQTLSAYVIEHLAGRLETVTGLGLGLANYTALDAETATAKARAKADFLVVTDAQGRLLSGRGPEDGFLPAVIADQSELTFSRGGRFWLGRKLRGPGGETAAYVFLARAEPDGRELAWAAFHKHWPVYVAYNLLAAALLAIILIHLARQAEGGRSRLGLLLTPFLLVQLGCYLMGLGDVFEAHLEQRRAEAWQLTQYFAADLGKIASRGIALSEIDDLNPYLERLARLRPPLARLAVLGPDGRLLAATAGAPELDESLRLTWPLLSAGAPAGLLEAWLSPSVLRRDRLSLILDNLTMTLAAGLLFLELAHLLTVRLRPGQAAGQRETAGPEVMRPAVFVALMSLDMSLSFVPLKMAEMRGGLWGLDEKILWGLPISVEMALCGLFTLAGGLFARRLGGWRPLFLSGLFVLAGGYLLSGLAESPSLYILARGLAGAGYGLLNIAAQIFVTARCRPEQKGEALGNLFAGFFSGGLCGCAAGGLLADRFGYNPVFFLSAGLFVLLAVLTLAFWPTGPAPASAPAAPRVALGGFLRSKAVWNFTLLTVIPASLALVGLVNYFLPLHLKALGAGPATIGQLNALFSILVVLAGPLCGRGLDRSRRPWRYLALAGVLTALAFPSFLFWPTLIGALAGLVCLGLATALNEGGEPAYLLSLPEAELVGDETALSFYNTVGRLGHMLGPLTVAAAWSLWGLGGLNALGLATFLATLLFWRLAASFRPARARQTDHTCP